MKQYKPFTITELAILNAMMEETAMYVLKEIKLRTITKESRIRQAIYDSYKTLDSFDLARLVTDFITNELMTLLNDNDIVKMVRLP